MLTSDSGASHYLVVADPTSSRTWAQMFEISGGIPQPRSGSKLKVIRGANGDFNVDGKSDVLISYSMGTKGFFKLFLGDPLAQPGQPPLRPAY